jgi:hypothetical protein
MISECWPPWSSHTTSGNRTNMELPKSNQKFTNLSTAKNTTINTFPRLQSTQRSLANGITCVEPRSLNTQMRCTIKVFSSIQDSSVVKLICYGDGHKVLVTCNPKNSNYFLINIMKGLPVKLLGIWYSELNY